MLGEEALDLGQRLDRIVLAGQEHEVLEVAPAREERVDSLERRADVAEAAPVAHVALEQVYARPACERALEPSVLRVVRLLVDVDVDDAALGVQAFGEAGQLVEVLVGGDDVREHVERRRQGVVRG